MKRKKGKGGGDRKTVVFIFFKILKQGSFYKENSLKFAALDPGGKRLSGKQGRCSLGHSKKAAERLEAVNHLCIKGTAQGTWWLGGGSGGQRAAGRRNTLKVSVYNLRLCMFVTKARCCITERRLCGWQ